jgi:acyl carrier protein
VNANEIRAIVEAAVHHVAPDVDPRTLPPGANLREDLEIDSMDFLNFVDELHTRLGVDIPEHDYPLVVTVDGCVEYLARRTSPA